MHLSLKIHIYSVKNDEPIDFKAIIIYLVANDNF